jgi:hypothetical protein
MADHYADARGGSILTLFKEWQQWPKLSGNGIAAEWECWGMAWLSGGLGFQVGGFLIL